MKVVTLYEVEDKDVVNALLYVPGDDFYYVSVEDINALVRQYQSRGVIVNRITLPAGLGSKTTLNIDSKTKSDPEKAFVPQKKAISLCVIPVRPSTLKKLKGDTSSKKELVIEVMEQKSTKTSDSSSLTPENKDKLTEQMEKLPDHSSM